jgi:succinate-acetate transporter protein
MTEDENVFGKVFQVDPAPLGLTGFALTTFLLSFTNAGFIHTTGGTGAAVAFAFAYGGIAQLIAGQWEMRRGSQFGFVAFSSYGAFWLWYVFIVVFSHFGVISVGNQALGLSLILWGFLTLYLYVTAIRLNLALNLVFLFLWLAFFFLGAGALTGSTVLTHIGGYTGIITAFFAIYTAFAIVTNSNHAGRIPLGPGLKKKS